MKRMIIGMMLAAGSLAATAVRAQELEAQAGPVQPQRPAYGAYVNNEDATPDAYGRPIANPNPMSRFMDGAQNEPPVAMPLVDRLPGTDADKQ
jgi:hypothetical protein